MGEIRIVGPGKSRGYPYLVCKKTLCDISSLLNCACANAFRSHFRGGLSTTDVDRDKNVSIASG